MDTRVPGKEIERKILQILSPLANDFYSLLRTCFPTILIPSCLKLVSTRLPVIVDARNIRKTIISDSVNNESRYIRHIVKHCSEP